MCPLLLFFVSVYSLHFAVSAHYLCQPRPYIFASEFLGVVELQVLSWIVGVHMRLWCPIENGGLVYFKHFIVDLLHSKRCTRCEPTYILALRSFGLFSREEVIVETFAFLSVLLFEPAEGFEIVELAVGVHLLLLEGVLEYVVKNE